MASENGNGTSGAEDAVGATDDERHGNTSENPIGGGTSASGGGSGAIAPGDVAEAKRGRGRPKGSGSGRSGSGGSGGGGGGGGSGSGGRTSERPEKTAKLDLGAFARQIQGVHSIAAMGLESLGVPFSNVFLIGDAESRDLAGAIHDVAKCHNIVISPKLVAYFNLIGTVGVIHGVRILTWRSMLRNAQHDYAAHQQAARQHRPASVEPNGGVYDNLEPATH